MEGAPPAQILRFAQDDNEESITPATVILSVAKDLGGGPYGTVSTADFVSLCMGPRDYFVYVLASRSQALYVGVTSDLTRRLAEHRRGEGSAFAQKYRVTRLVYVETFGFVGDALRREKQLKGWTRARKVRLIESTNPDWRDLAEYPLPDPSLRSG